MPHNVIIEDKNAPIADIGSVNVLMAADREKYTPAKKESFHSILSHMRLNYGTIGTLLYFAA